MSKSWRLGVEELAVALGVAGGEDVAAGLLMAILGPRSPEEMDGRMLAAGHSLVARGLLVLRGDEKRLDEGLSSALLPLVQQRFSLRCSRAEAEGEDLATYFVGPSEVSEHRLRQAVVSELTLLPGAEEATARSAAFFGLKAARRSALAEPVATLAAATLQQARVQAVDEGRAAAAASLLAGGVPEAIAQQVAQDLATPRFHGSVLRVEQGQEGPASDRGFLLLQGAERPWLCDMLPGEPLQLALYRGDGATYAALFTPLLS